MSACDSRRGCRPSAAGIGRPATEEGAERLPHDQRGGGRTSHPAACAALLGDEIPAGEAAEARRRSALLPARRHLPAAADFGSAVHSRLYDQGRAAPAARGRRPAVRRHPAAPADEQEARRGGARRGGCRRSRNCRCRDWRPAAAPTARCADRTVRPEGRPGDRAPAGASARDAAANWRRCGPCWREAALRVLSVAAKPAVPRSERSAAW